MNIKPQTKKILKIIFAVIAYIILIALFWWGWRTRTIQHGISHAGIYGPIAYTLVATLKALFPIIPGEVLVTFGVLAFGPVMGFSLALVGLTLGSTIAFFLARRFGSKFVVWLMGKERFEKLHKLTGDKTVFTFLLIYLTPGTPDDFVTYIAGLTGINYGLFIIVCVLGRLPSYILYLLAGQSLRTLNFRLLFFWWAVLFAVVGALYLSKKHIFDKWQKRIKNTARKE